MVATIKRKVKLLRFENRPAKYAVVPGRIEDIGEDEELRRISASQAYSFVGAVPGIIAGALRVSACSQ